MERSGDPELLVWGTWEELLLACAVNRHGTRRWDSVAMEIQARSPFSHLLTPQSCRRHYRDLQLRFGGGSADEQGDEDEEAGSPAEVPWVEELRKLRVAELRREVERYDASIGYLQVKVKRLEEERERSSKRTESGERKLDHVKESGDSPEMVYCDAISGEESNSTLPKEEHKKLDREGVKASEAVGTGGEPVGTVSSQPAGESGESMVAESKREEEEEEEEEEEGEKDCSDVQCSVSPSRQRRRTGLDGSSGGEEGEEESLVTNKRDGAETEPLGMYLETIRSNHHGSTLERGLASQDTDSGRYRSLIRRHVDFEMVRTKLDTVGSDGCPYATAEFMRDMLLLFTNAILFYPKHSPESIAAVHLRHKFIKQIPTRFRPSTPVLPSSPPSPDDIDLAAPPAEKPAPIIVWRRRNSISNARKEEVEEKSQNPEPEELSNEEKNKGISVPSKKKRGLRTNKNRSNLAREVSTATKRLLEDTSAVEAAARSNDKSGGAVLLTSPASSSEKKKRTVGLPSRTKRNSKGMAETSSSTAEEGKASAERKKRGKDNAVKDEIPRQGAGGAGGGKAATSGRGKRSVGRPPKRAASPVKPSPAKKARGSGVTRALRSNLPLPSPSPSPGIRRKRGRRS